MYLTQSIEHLFECRVVYFRDQFLDQPICTTDKYMYTVSISTWKLLVVVTVKKVYKIWKENKVVALRVRLIPQCMLNEFIYI